MSVFTSHIPPFDPSIRLRRPQGRTLSLIEWVRLPLDSVASLPRSGSLRATQSVASQSWRLTPFRVISVSAALTGLDVSLLIRFSGLTPRADICRPSGAVQTVSWLHEHSWFIVTRILNLSSGIRNRRFSHISPFGSFRHKSADLAQGDRKRRISHPTSAYVQP